MENASKALLIAGSMLMALLVISLVVLAYNGIRSSYKSQDEALSASQLAEFNSQFEAYNRENIMGIELASLLNKINDYNSKYVPEGYSKITTNLEELINKGIEDGDISSEFKGKKFKCSKFEYDKKTGRVIKMEFVEQ